MATIFGVLTPASSGAWGRQGHRVVGRVAEAQLSAVARRTVRWLLAGQRLEDVGSWADAIADGYYQTSLWHFVNIPAREAAYDRERDCPRQAGAPLTGRGSRWRDCVVDRIEYHAARLADRTLDPVDRATALKFLVHLIADVHQPFHAIATERGGNGIRIELFGVSNCEIDGGTSAPCNLHLAWDSGLMRHRGLRDEAYAADLQAEMKRRDWASQVGPREGVPADWAAESLALAKRYMVPNGARVDGGYYARAIRDVDERLARAALRLAGVLNRTLTEEPPTGRPIRRGSGQ